MVAYHCQTSLNLVVLCRTYRWSNFMFVVFCFLFPHDHLVKNCFVNLKCLLWPNPVEMKWKWNEKNPAWIHHWWPAWYEVCSLIIIIIFLYIILYIHTTMYYSFINWVLINFLVVGLCWWPCGIVCNPLNPLSLSLSTMSCFTL